MEFDQWVESLGIPVENKCLGTAYLAWRAAMRESLSGKSWRGVDRPPNMIKEDIGWLVSVPVLGFFKTGYIAVVTYEQIDEDSRPCWFTACSEKWDVTEKVSHWMPLPPFPSRTR